MIITSIKKNNKTQSGQCAVYCTCRLLSNLLMPFHFSMQLTSSFFTSLFLSFAYSTIVFPLGRVLSRSRATPFSWWFSTRCDFFSHFFGCVPEETLADITPQFFRQIQDFTYQSIVTIKLNSIKTLANCCAFGLFTLIRFHYISCS